MTGSVAVDEALLALKLAFLVLLYLFIWRIVRSAARDLRAPQAHAHGHAQESVILSPAEIAALERERGRPPRLVVLESPALTPGREIVVDSAPVALGRAAGNDVRLDGDEFASSQHARFEPREDGLWVVDTGSTNGTFVNGARVTESRRLRRGDVVRIGGTDLRVEL